MNRRREYNEDELLDILEQMIPAQFKKLCFKLKVPKNILPSEDKDQTSKAIALLEWATAPGGCGLQPINSALEAMNLCLSKPDDIYKNSNDIHKIAETRLLNFDHKLTLKTFEDILEQLEYRENAGIFILQDCWNRGGKYCHKRLIHYLSRNTAEGKFHIKKIGYLGGDISRKNLLFQLANELNIRQDWENLNERDIIDAIAYHFYHLVPKQDSGHTYLFHIKGYDSLLGNESFWDWFIKNFWTHLIERITLLANQHRLLKVIFLFEVEIYIKITADYICESSKKFDRSKIIELPLEPCEIKEIEDWLYKFSCLPSEIVEQSLSIVRSTDRRPERVYDFFRDRLIEYLQNA